MAKLLNGPTLSLSRAAAALIVCLTLAAACGSSNDDPVDSGATGTDPSGDVTGEDSPDTGDAAPDTDTGDTVDDFGPVLQPAALITPDQPGGINSVAVAPDGTQVALSSQDGLGTPVTIALYDIATGQQTQTTEADVIGLGRLHWMADNRLVAAANSAESEWLVWDGSTLAELPSLPLDPTCAEGRADKQAGAIYSSDGIVSMGDTLCRFDTTDGSTVRTADGVLVGASEFWIVPSAGGVKVLHAPDPDVSNELLTLDGTTLAPTDSLVVEYPESVTAVGESVWLTATDIDFNRTSRLEPGAIPLPDLSPRGLSGSGTLFVTEAGADETVFISSSDGTVLGSVPTGMNLAFSDWSIDDSVFARVNPDGAVEVYEF